MRCVIYGAAGFIGRHLATTLRDEGHEVLGFDVVEATGVERCDVAREVPPLPGGVDIVYYLSQSPAYRSFPEGADDLFAVNLVGAVRVAERAAEAGAGVLCYASTGTVYAPSFEPMDETRAVRRDQPYALSKLAAEEALALFKDLAVVCPRLFGVYGPGQRNMMVPAIIQRVREGQAVTIERTPRRSGDTSGLRISITFVDDVVRGLIDLAEIRRGGIDVLRVVNLAAGRATSIRTLAETAGAILGRAPSFEVVDRERPSDYVADVTRLRALIDWRETPLEEAVRRTVEAGPHV